jgi:hypothetical protein
MSQQKSELDSISPVNLLSSAAWRLNIILTYGFSPPSVRFNPCHESRPVPTTSHSLGGQLLQTGSVKVTPICNVYTATMPNRPRAKDTYHFRPLPRVNVGAGIVQDIRARTLWYWRDRKDAWNYRALPATALISLSFVVCNFFFLFRRPS